MAIGWEKDMLDLVGDEGLLLDAGSRTRLSKDYYWYSPVLEPKLREKLADGVALPSTEEELVKVLTFAYRRSIPVTVRGAGTGNYGQAVPLQGGLVIDLSRMDRILELGGGTARVQCGVKLGTLERRAREAGWELRIYPSTFMKATVGGFVCGGSGGIGSVTWGNLWDGNVLEAVVYTMEAEPRRLVVRERELYDYIHNYGTTGIVTELVIPLAPRTEWMQSVVQFPELAGAVQFGETLAADGSIAKRLVSPMEWPIPAYFTPIVSRFQPGEAAVLLETADGTSEAVRRLAEDFGGRIGHATEAAEYRKSIGLSDFTWNHTTLWALKSDPGITYLQAGFSPADYLEQIRMIKAAFGSEVLLHFEWIRSGGVLTPSSLPLVHYRSEERLYEIIAFFEQHGVRIYDPHTWVLADGGRGEAGSMSRRKRLNDPRGLLNPGKLTAAPAEGEGGAAHGHE
ncbi:FAD-binding oxidoreductase [Paenibacillus caseinilyticus]|uniref:FAD-linked oxidase n=1 Tax=Paenibacillus mucilaginosus K02 TaxID=997761 RepID=I0BJL3_9BACL|nr:FAD-binding oxidoreductase [Paenibacillus mucilaginosus]AFH62560.1 FAD-linked oxidase [Paenibacillus mucilaginosus K02]